MIPPQIQCYVNVDLKLSKETTDEILVGVRAANTFAITLDPGSLPDEYLRAVVTLDKHVVGVTIRQTPASPDQKSGGPRFLTVDSVIPRAFPPMTGIRALSPMGSPFLLGVILGLTIAVVRGLFF